MYLGKQKLANISFELNNFQQIYNIVQGVLFPLVRIVICKAISAISQDIGLKIVTWVKNYKKNYGRWPWANGQNDYANFGLYQLFA